MLPFDTSLCHSPLMWGTPGRRRVVPSPRVTRGHPSAKGPGGPFPASPAAAVPRCGLLPGTGFVERLPPPSAATAGAGGFLSAWFSHCRVTGDKKPPRASLGRRLRAGSCAWRGGQRPEPAGGRGAAPSAPAAPPAAGDATQP